MANYTIEIPLKAALIVEMEAISKNEALEIYDDLIISICKRQDGSVFPVINTMFVDNIIFADRVIISSIEVDDVDDDCLDHDRLITRKEK